MPILVFRSHKATGHINYRELYDLEVRDSKSGRVKKQLEDCEDN